MSRDEVLDKAKQCVSGNREQDYGTPEHNFSVIADLWTVYLFNLDSAELTPKDVAAMLSLMKIARISSGHAKEDNWVDLAGYAACGGELESEGL